MRLVHWATRAACIGLFACAGTGAHATYWNLFNEEGESTFSSQFATYATLSDMLSDDNRLGVFTPNTLGAGPNIVGSGSDRTTYWNLFNEEGESSFSSQFVTYATLGDMLSDDNRLGVFAPDALGAGPNIVGSGSDGTTYWNLFNEEGEAGFSSQFVTYATLGDMLTDDNRLGVFTPNTLGAGPNIVDAGSNGLFYWSLFNEEGESGFSAQYVTYASLNDMLLDDNRLGISTPTTLGAGPNIVGSGSDSFPSPTSPVPEPASWALLTIGFGIVGSSLRRRQCQAAYT